MEGLCAGDDAGSDLNPKDRSLVAPVTSTPARSCRRMFLFILGLGSGLGYRRVWVERNSNRILKVFN